MTGKGFQQESHNFNKHAKYTTVNLLTSTPKFRETLTKRLINLSKEKSFGF